MTPSIRLSRYTVVGIAIVAFLVIGMTGASATATHQGPTCEAEETELVVLSPAGDHLDTAEELRLYPGSELTVVLCEDGEALEPGTEWSLAEADTYRITDETETGVNIVVQQGEPIDFTAQIETVELDGSVTLEPPVGNFYRSETGLFTQQFRLHSEDARTQLLTREAAVVETAARISNLTEQIAAGADELNDTTDPAVVEEQHRLLVAVAEARTDFEQNVSEIELILHQYAMNSSVEQTPSEMLDTLDSNRSAVDEQTANATSTMFEELTAIESEAQSTVRVNVAIGLVVGLGIGLVVGVIGPYRKGREVDDFYQVSSKNEFNTDVLRLPWLLGGLLLLGGLGALVWFGHLGVIV